MDDDHVRIHVKHVETTGVSNNRPLTEVVFFFTFQPKLLIWAKRTEEESSGEPQLSVHQKYSQPEQRIYFIAYLSNTFEYNCRMMSNKLSAALDLEEEDRQRLIAYAWKREAEIVRAGLADGTMLELHFQVRLESHCYKKVDPPKTCSICLEGVSETHARKKQHWACRVRMSFTAAVSGNG